MQNRSYNGQPPSPREQNSPSSSETQAVHCGHADKPNHTMSLHYYPKRDLQPTLIAVFLNFVGPLPNTVTDLWWLVWQERIHVVAMVTNILERGQQKCEQYWPDEGTKEYGPFKVTLADQQVFADYTIRQLFVSVSIMN